MFIAGCSGRDESPYSQPETAPQAEKYAEGYYPGTEHVVIDEDNLELAGEQEFSNDTRVTRTHTFSDGYEYTYTSLGDHIVVDDIMVATVEEHAKILEDYEKILAERDRNVEIETAGAAAKQYCAVSFPFWCAALIGRSWKNGVVPYVIQKNDFNDDELGKIDDAIKEIEAASDGGIDFQLFDDRGQFPGPDRVYIRKEGAGDCSSWMGRKGGGRQYLNLGTNCLKYSSGKGVAIHELMHALGFMHEHQRSDRNSFITILTPFNYRYFNVKQTYSIDTGTTYDYKSVMHYPEEIDGRVVFSVKDERYAGIPGQRLGLSAKDTVAIRQRYR